MDRTVSQDSGECLFGSLLSEPLCVITNDVTYQEKIEALSGTIYDYDDVNDTEPGYFDYDDPRDYEEWCGWDDPGDDGMSYDPSRSEVSIGGTVVSQVWSGD